MKKTILIIRSVSFQQLDKNLTEIVKRFPTTEYEYHLLTHGHGLAQAETYTVLTEAIDYDSRQNFSYFHIPPPLKHKNRHTTPPYEAIIVPVTNKTGVGFLNVLTMVLRIPSHTIYICNLVSEIQEISRGAIHRQLFGALGFSFLAGILAIPFSLVTLPAILCYLSLHRKH